MKLLILLTVIACFQVSARGFGQTISISLKNAPLEHVFREIKRQSGYSFVYTRAQIKTAHRVSIDIRNAEIREVLKLCFRNQPLSFLIEDRYVIVQTKSDEVENIVFGASTIDISGKIMNENGESLPGATVSATESAKATSTNEQGEFLLSGINDDDILIITCIGYYPQEVSVDKQKHFVVRLRISVSNLDETIVRGYYNTTRRLNTGSVSKVTGAQLSRQPISNPILGLEGLVPGLLVTQTNGLPGSRFRALIRGQNSIQSGSSPLYIIDGVPFLSDNDALTQLNGILANSPFNSLDPSNIESIEVLKDADATAIYGSKGANGVILITTKKAKSDKSTIAASFYYGWEKVTRTVELMNTDQYLEMRRGAFTNDGMVPTNVNAPDLVSWSSSRYTNWKKKFIGGTAKTSNASIRYSGGSAATKFSFGGSYYRESTVFPGNFANKRTTFDLNINHHALKDKISIVLSSSYAYEKNLLPSLDLTTFINLPPNSYPLKDSSGKFIWRESDYSVGNPLAALLQENRVTSDRLTANSVISYHPFKALEVKANLGYNNIAVDETTLSPIVSQDPAYAPQGSSVLGNSNIKTWIFEPQITYNFTIRTKLNIETLIGSTWQKNNYSRKLITAYGYSDDNLLTSVSGASSITAANSLAEYNYAATYARIGANWKKKYIVNASGRRDGSSRFGPDKRFANFAAIGIAWIFSKESFVEKSLPFLSFGKLRASYGTTGNDQIGNYQYLDSYSLTVFPYQGQPGLYPSRLFNANYSWERNKKLDIAAEFGFLNDKIQLTANWYKNRSDNQIIRYSLPNQTGFPNILMNFPGVVENAGFELTTNAIIINRSKVQWNASINFSTNRNKLISFPGLESSSYATSYVIGKPLNAFLGFHFTGVDPQTGIYQFEDVNRDGNIDNDDFRYIGTTNPDFVGGFTNSLTYKNLQLDFLIEFRRQLGTHVIYSSSTALGDIVNQPVAGLNRWRKPGDHAPFQRYTQDFTNPAYNPATFNMASSGASLTNASYVRVRNIALSYTMPTRITNRIRCESWKIFLQAHNLFTITRYEGNDPENQSFTSLPPLKIATVGMNVIF